LCNRFFGALAPEKKKKRKRGEGEKTVNGTEFVARGMGG